MNKYIYKRIIGNIYSRAPLVGANELHQWKVKRLFRISERTFFPCSIPMHIGTKITDNLSTEDTYSTDSN